MWSVADYNALKVMDAKRTTAAPYGAATLRDTNFKQLAKSLHAQIASAGLPQPKKMNLKPFWHRDGISDGSKIIGNSSPKIFDKSPEGALNAYFPDQPRCQSANFDMATFNAFAALHETAHYIAARSFGEAGTNLDSQVFDHVNKTPFPQTPGTFIENVEKAQVAVNRIGGVLDVADLSKSLDDRLTVALATGGSFGDWSTGHLPERIADGSAVLYALSNYKDAAATTTFARNLEAMRDVDNVEGSALNMRSHDTSSSVEAALRAFAENPRKGLTIVETTTWAADLVKNQPEFNRDFASMAETVRNGTAASLAFHHNPKDPLGYVTRALPNLPAKDKDAIKEEIERIRKGRQGFCRAGPSSH